MAHPINSFIHQDLPDERLYFVHNTFFEIQETIPMDLATLFWYLTCQNYSLEGILVAWDDIETSGSSMRNMSFDDIINEDQRILLNEDIIFSGTLNYARKNKSSSHSIREFLNHKSDDIHLEEVKIKSLIKQLPISHRSLEYYYSRHHLYSLLWDTYEDLDLLNSHNDYSFLIKTYELLIVSQPEAPIDFLYSIPHKHQINGVLACIIDDENMSDLLPLEDRTPVIEEGDIEFLLSETDFTFFSRLVIKYADSSFQKNRPLLLDSLEIEESIFLCADVDLQLDNEFVNQAVNRNGLAIQFLRKDFRSDRSIAVKSVTQNGLALQYTTLQHKSDKIVVTEAVKNNGQSLQYAFDDLKADKDVVLLAVMQNGFALQYAATQLKNNRAIAIEAVKNNGRSLQYASNEIKGDKDVVLQAVMDNGLALQYASTKLKSDKVIVMEAVKNIGRSLQYASDKLKADRFIVLQAVKQDYEAIKHASHVLQNDKDIQLALNPNPLNDLQDLPF